MEAGPLLGFAGLIVFIILIGVFSARVRQSYEDTIKALAEPHGLSYNRVAPGAVATNHHVTGKLDGRDFEFKVEPDGRQRILSERWFITLKTQFPEGFAAGKNGWLRRPSEGMTFVTTGDPSFDGDVFIEVKDPKTAEGLITPARKEALASLASRNGLVYGGKVMFHKNGFDTKVEKLQERLAWLRDVANKLDA